MITLIQIILILICAVAHFYHGSGSQIIIPVSALLAIVACLAPSQKKNKGESALNQEPPQKEQSEEPILKKDIQKQVIDDTSVVNISALGSAYRKNEWQQIENTVDSHLDNCIRLIKSRIDAHTVAIFSLPSMAD
ncbi:MAG TPA: hypothetical protein VHO70_17045 [Chitinispirillaceae bacterium]|nr:hypothetical protein [Chitinispirillaceae bacterium]